MEATTNGVITEQQRNESAILSTLLQLGGQRVQQDALKHSGKELILPEAMTVREAVEYLKEWEQAMEETNAFSRTFHYRPNDVAHALSQALKEVFGTAGIGKPSWSFFGPSPPQMQSIAIGPAMTTMVPWGEIATPMIGGSIELGSRRHPEYGYLGHLDVYAPKKFTPHVEGLFIAIENVLRRSSIYKGKAIDGAYSPEFLDLTGVDPSKVVYSDKVLENLNTNIWAYIEHADLMRMLDVSLKRANLLFGPWGSGKTLAAFLTAKLCSENGWTFLYCRPAKDNILEVMQTARLYQPSLVHIEDVDNIAGGADISKLLDVFDGITAKGTEIQVVLTTNHPERIHKAMMRPGRLDSMTEIGALDLNGMRRMIQATVEEGTLDEDISYEVIFGAMEGYLPAFVAEVIKRAIVTAATRENRRPERYITEDFVVAAHSLRDQYDRMTDATEGSHEPTLEATFTGLIEKTIDGVQLHDEDGDVLFNGAHLSVEE